MQRPEAAPPAGRASRGTRRARHRAHRGRELLHGGAVHEVHAVAQRHAKRDADNRERRAAARAAPGEESEKAQHADYYTGSMKWLLLKWLILKWLLLKWLLLKWPLLLLGSLWALPVPAQEAPEWFVESFLDLR